jgi:hypothetical protein
MNRKKMFDSPQERRRAVMCILAVLLMLIMTAPSFASNEKAEEGKKIPPKVKDLMNGINEVFHWR